MERFFSKLFSGNKFLSIFELGRPWNGLASSIAALIGIILASVSIPPINTLLLASLSFFCCFLAGTVLNDIFGMDIDKLNMPFRPLQSKRVTYKEALIFMIGTYIVGIGLSLFLTFKFFITVIIFVIGSIFYSLPPLSLEKKSFLAQLSLSIVSFFIPVYSGVVLVTDTFIIPSNLLTLFISFTLLYSFAIIIKDFKDIKGDKIGKKRTFVLHVGEKVAKFIMITGTLIMFPMTIFILNSIFDDWSFVALSTLSFVMTLYYEFNVKNNPEKAFQNVRLSISYFLILVLLFSIIK